MMNAIDVKVPIASNENNAKQKQRESNIRQKKTDLMKKVMITTG